MSLPPSGRQIASRRDRARASRSRRARGAGGELTRGTGGGGVRVERRRARGGLVRCNGAIFLGPMPSAPPTTLPLPARASVSGRLALLHRHLPLGETTRNPRADHSPAGPALGSLVPTDSVTNPGRARRCLLLHHTRSSARAAGSIHPAVS